MVPFDKKVWLSSPTMHGLELKYVTEAYETNWMSTVGENINEAERLSCEKIGCKYAVALSCGTAALHMAIKLAGVKPGDKVFCTDMTFGATVNPIVYEKGIPVFIDTEYDTWNMDPVALEQAFRTYPDTKVVVTAHLYGTPGKIDELLEICNRHGAIMIEDAAESLGATYRGKQTGSFGKYSAISFNGNKIITTSGGGMLLSADEEITKKALFLATQARDQARYYQHSELGYNYRMSNVVAGIGRGQLLHLEEHKALKKAIYQQYKEALADIDEITMNPLNPDGDANNWLSCITLKEGSRVMPNDIMDALDAENIESRPIWKPMHLQPIYADAEFFMADGQQLNTAKVKGDNGEDWDRSVSGDIFRRGLCLPSDIKNTQEDMQRIIEIVRGCFK